MWADPIIRDTSLDSWMCAIGRAVDTRHAESLRRALGLQMVKTAVGTWTDRGAYHSALHRTVGTWVGLACAAKYVLQCAMQARARACT